MADTTPVAMTCLVGGSSPVDGLPADPSLASYQAQLQQQCELLAQRKHTLPDFKGAYRVQEIIEAILSTEDTAP